MGTLFTSPAARSLPEMVQSDLIPIPYSGIGPQRRRTHAIGPLALLPGRAAIELELAVNRNRDRFIPWTLDLITKPLAEIDAMCPPS